MTPSKNAEDLIQRAEDEAGFLAGACTKLDAYPDPASGAEPWTIGWGTTKDVKPGDKITAAEADALLRRDLALCGHSVESLLPVPLTQNQFDALCSFVYNLGAGNLKQSTLKRKILAGDFAGAAEEFPRWDRAAGKEMAGLKKRRLWEKARFETA